MSCTRHHFGTCVDIYFSSDDWCFGCKYRDMNQDRVEVLPNRNHVVEALEMQHALEETTMAGGISDCTFTVDLDSTSEIKPLPTTIKRKYKSERIFLPDAYERNKPEFFEMCGQCAEYIDHIEDVPLRTKYNKDLSKIFVIRDYQKIMRLFRELANLRLKS